MPKTQRMEVGKVKGGSIGLTYPMLARSNYTAWALKMRVFMQAQGAWSAVEPSDSKATIDEKIDKVAMAMIYQGIPEEVLLSLADKKSAKKVWDAIKTLCQGADRVKKARIQTLKSEFEALCMKENEQIDDFQMRMNSLVTNIRALGEEVEESYVVKKLLRAVPSRFLQITSTMEQFGDLDTMSMEEAIGSLKAHEERVKGKTESSEAQLMLTEEEWAKREGDDGKLLLTREKWLKRSTNDRPSGSKYRNGRDKSKLMCYNCGIQGHFAADCRRPKRSRDYKQEANMASVEDDEPALLLAKLEKKKPDIMVEEDKVALVLLTKNHERVNESNLWYLDNGASNHMTGYKIKFT